MTHSLEGKRVLLIGSGSGIGSAIAATLRAEGAVVMFGGRNPDKFADAAQRLRTTEPPVYIDLSDEDTLRAVAEQVRGQGGLDHVINLASSPPNVPVVELNRDDVIAAFDAKVIGPLLLAKHLGPVINEDGSLVLFSGVAAWRPSKRLAVMATTNGAVSFLVSALALELAPVRINAISPGVVDSGAWDARLGEGKTEFFDRVRASNPVRRVGGADRHRRRGRHAPDQPVHHGRDLACRRGRSLRLKRPGDGVVRRDLPPTRGLH